MARRKRDQWGEIPDNIIESDPLDLLDDEDGEGEERPFSEAAAPMPLPVAPPETAEDELQRYERKLGGDVQVIDKASYNSLRGFVNDRPDRAKWKLAIFRCADMGVRDRSRLAYVARIAIPSGILDEYLKDNFGGGAYRWQLCLAHRFAGRADLPQSMQDIPMEGFLDIDAPAKGSESEAVQRHAESVTEIQSANDKILQLTMDTMKEQMEKVRGDSKANTDALVQMSNVMLGGMQSQMTLMQTVAGQQNTFLMGLLDRQRDESKGRVEEKSGMYDRMLELVMKFAGKGDESSGPESTVQTLIKSFPQVVDMLGKNPVFGAPPAGSPAAAALPAPVAPVAPQQPATPPAAPAQPQGEEEMWAVYLTSIVTQCYTLFKSGIPAEAAAPAVSSLGSDSEHDRFLAMNESEVLQLVDGAYRQYVDPNGTPQELLNWVKKLYIVLHTEEEDENDSEPTPVEAATPTAQPPSGTSAVVQVDAQVIPREPDSASGATGPAPEIEAEPASEPGNG